MTYPVLLILHLFAALIFIGTVFFEVLILESVRKRLPRTIMREVEREVGNRARKAFVPPSLPEPIVRGSTPPDSRATRAPTGIEPAR